MINQQQRALLTDSERHSLELLEKATAGEWEVFHAQQKQRALVGIMSENIRIADTGDGGMKTAEINAIADHIADAHNRMADMLVEIARLRERVGLATRPFGKYPRLTEINDGYVIMINAHDALTPNGVVWWLESKTVFPTADAAFAALEAYLKREKGEGDV